MDTAGDDPLKAFHLVPDTVESTTSRSMFLLAQSTMVPLKSNALEQRLKTFMLGADAKRRFEEVKDHTLIVHEYYRMRSELFEI